MISLLRGSIRAMQAPPSLPFGFTKMAIWPCQPGGDARAKLARLRTTIASGTGPTGDVAGDVTIDTAPDAAPDIAINVATDQAIRGWYRRDPEVAERLRRVDNRRTDYLRTLYRGICADPDDVEARSLLSYSLWISRPLIAADNGTRDPGRHSGEQNNETRNAARIDKVTTALLQQ